MTRRSKWAARVLASFAATVLALTIGSTFLPGAPQIEADKKAKFTGTIVSRSGDLVKITNHKSGATAIVVVNDTTKIERKKFSHEFFVHKDMDMTALVPGLTIAAEGVGNAKGQLIAKTISFVPDTFSIEVAEEQQILNNQSAAAKAQATANSGVQQAQAAQASADAAQTSANKAQASANKAGAAANDAGELAVYNAADIALVNKRVSDLDDYKVVGEAAIFFDSGKYNLDDAAKAAIDTVWAYTKGLDNYMIEIAGYASSTGTKQLDQKLSADRAAAVTRYLIDKHNVPMRRILAPVGYGASHPAAENTDSQGRAINRRVDVKVLINKGLSEGD
jgi:outer membrane protein OmpA-like peptidoglycan-associated protein